MQTRMTHKTVAQSTVESPFDRLTAMGAAARGGTDLRAHAAHHRRRGPAGAAVAVDEAAKCAGGAAASLTPAQAYCNDQVATGGAGWRTLRAVMYLLR